MKRNFFVNTLLLIVTLFFFVNAHAASNNDPMPSWNNGTSKQSIVQFVNIVTDKNNPDYVSPEDRIATFDNDGTLWLEQPMYTQVIFALDRIKTLAATHPDWGKEEPFKSIVNKDYTQITSQDIMTVFAITQSGMSIEDYQAITKTWLATAKNPRFKRYYVELIYQPMLEVMQYLRQHDFKVYIVSGSGQDFIRAYAQKTYGVPVEQVIGTTFKTNYVYLNGQPQLMKMSQILFINDKEGKPQAINLFIGKKPIIAFGNSDGDKQMLEWTQSNKRKHLLLLVHHDDAKREYAYDTQAKVGTFSSALMQEAQKNNWQVISMKNDWKVIFPAV